MGLNYENIIKDTNEVVRKKSKAVTLPLNNEDRSFLNDMLTYVRNSQDDEVAEKENLRPAVGIAAIQLGNPKKMIAIVIGDEHGETQEYALVNPHIVSESVQKAYLKSGEGCLSVEEVHEGLVPRSARITIKAYDMLQDCDITIKAHGYLAIVLQHEMDHFNGILFYDRIDQRNPWAPIPDSIIIE